MRSAKVLLLSAAPENDERFPWFAREDLRRLLSSARKDTFRVHTLTDDPGAADLIIFVEREHAVGPYLEHVRRHPYVKAYREKCFVCNSRYHGIPILPGVYGSVPKSDHFFDHRLRSGAYTEVFEEDRFTFDPAPVERTYLYTFVGSVYTYPKVRGALAALDHPRGLFYDTSRERKEVFDTLEITREKARYMDRYVDLTRRSQFVLAPRGDAVNSMRLFESMRMGRAPVIISDGWVAPRGPDWDAFSLRIAEKDIPRVPQILERHEHRAEEMGLRARTAWEEWFSEEVSFHRVVEWCLDMLEERSVPETTAQRLIWLKLLTPFHLRRYLSTRVRLFQKHRKIFL